MNIQEINIYQDFLKGKWIAVSQDCYKEFNTPQEAIDFAGGLK